MNKTIENFNKKWGGYEEDTPIAVEWEDDLKDLESKIRAEERTSAIDEVVDWILSKFTYVDEFNVERVYCNADTLRINLKMQLKGETE